MKNGGFRQGLLPVGLTLSTTAGLTTVVTWPQSSEPADPLGSGYVLALGTAAPRSNGATVAFSADLTLTLAAEPYLWLSGDTSVSFRVSAWAYVPGDASGKRIVRGSPRVRTFILSVCASSRTVV